MIHLGSAQQRHKQIFFYQLKLRSQPTHLIIYLQSQKVGGQVLGTELNRKQNRSCVELIEPQQTTGRTKGSYGFFSRLVNTERWRRWTSV